MFGGFAALFGDFVCLSRGESAVLRRQQARLRRFPAVSELFTYLLCRKADLQCPLSASFAENEDAIR